ncbi:unnamed protein product [Ixodes pacificus]
MFTEAANYIEFNGQPDDKGRQQNVLRINYGTVGHSFLSCSLLSRFLKPDSHGAILLAIFAATTSRIGTSTMPFLQHEPRRNFEIASKIAPREWDFHLPSRTRGLKQQSQWSYSVRNTRCTRCRYDGIIICGKA